MTKKVIERKKKRNLKTEKHKIEKEEVGQRKGKKDRGKWKA